MSQSEVDTARHIMWRAYQKHMAGALEKAIALYQQSIELHPTTEAHTFLGWAFSMQGHYEKAIEECLQAITLDDQYGNPYNDIGVYLMALNRWNDAISWLERAIAAPRYDQRAMPYLNLARIYRHFGEDFKMLRAYRSAWELDLSQISTLDALQLAVGKLT